MNNIMKKYGRTYHHPLSEGVNSDDKIIPSMEYIEQADEIIITEKMDGENSTIFSGGCHARSVDSRHHVSQDWIKSFASGISPFLNNNEKIIGENLYAKYSIYYDNLKSYFYGFAYIVDGVFQSWDCTVSIFNQYGIEPVPIVYRGKYNKNIIKDLDFSEKVEGYVIRSTNSFCEKDMVKFMAKLVRKDHVQTSTHWKHQEVIKNMLTTQ